MAASFGSAAFSGCFAGAGFGAGALLPRPIIAFSSAISCCSCCSWGRSTSGAFLAFRGFGCFAAFAGFSARGSGCSCGSGFFSGCAGASGSGIFAGSVGRSGSFSGAGGSGCTAATGCCSASGRSEVSGSGSAVGFSTSSRSASSSGWASAPRSTSPVGISSGVSAGSSASRRGLLCPNRPSRFFGFCGSSSRRVISTGTFTAVVVKNERNFSSRAAISSGVRSRWSLVFFGILVPPVVVVGVPVCSCYPCCAPRCDWISYRMMPAATDTL